MKKSNAPLRTLLILSVLVLLATRIPTIWHNSLLHPDEHVFFISSSRLAEALLHIGPAYTPLCDYPEGAIVMQFPFHIAFKFFTRVTGRLLSLRFVGRVASFSYFAAAMGMGLWILHRYFPNFRITGSAFALSMIFGLLHIEQSRYGTGDPISFFLLMALFAVSALGMETKKLSWFCGGFVLSGMLGAIKYPQFYFLLIPLSCLLYIRKSFTHSAWKIPVFPFCLILGFLLLSPTMLTDPMTAIRTITREFSSYVTHGNYSEHGGVLNHLAALGLYSLLYSGIPLVGVLLALRFIPTVRRKPVNGVDFLFFRVIPLVIGGFFVYNLFASCLFMRTYYPFYCAFDFYCAILCGKLWHIRRARAFFTAMLAVMVVRGSYYLLVLGTDNPVQRLNSVLAQAETAVQEVTLSNPSYCLPFPEEALPEHDTISFSERFHSDDVSIRPGELLITVDMDYHWGQPYIIPVEDTYIPVWKQFKQVNKDFYIGSVYPNYYYPLFGFWIKGTTGTRYEFPTVQFFLHPLQ